MLAFSKLKALADDNFSVDQMAQFFFDMVNTLLEKETRGHDGPRVALLSLPDCVE